EGMGAVCQCGNDREWCSDGYELAFYRHSPPVDPVMPELISCTAWFAADPWMDESDRLRVARRNSEAPTESVRRSGSAVSSKRRGSGTLSFGQLPSKKLQSSRAVKLAIGVVVGMRNTTRELL